ncbi:thiamine pyrophosphate-binding protein [Egicoccus sp. AB-alg2]|uniref:thiamine pyrophosphate-binding protein n=1 Tax=Egicoccus sp. AB-alg2 TaxID=3242693 RepID=UPI00359EB3ED
MLVADALVRQLQALEVEYVFGLPGSTEGPLLDALGRVDQPRFVLGLHESIVVAMADGYARVSGRPGVVSLHTSVGTGNAVGQVMNSWVDRSPIVAIIGHKDARIANRDGFCTVEHLPGLLRPYTKWSRSVEDPQLAVEDLTRAFALAQRIPTGPVALVVTEDRAAADVEQAKEATIGATPAGAAPSSAAIEELRQRLRGASRPLFLAGDGVARTGARQLLVEVAEEFGVPVLLEPRRSAARINVPTDASVCCGEYQPDHPAVRDADLVVAFGARVFVEFEPATGSELPEGAALVHVHDDPSELNKRYPADQAIVASSAETLRALRGTADPMAAEEGRGRMRELVHAYRTARQERRDAAVDDDSSLSVDLVAQTLDERLADDTIVIDEGVRSSRVLLRHLQIGADREYHRNTGGAIGWGLPAAIGARLAAPERPVVLFVGDGSALMSIQALWTAARYELDVTVFVSNNRGYQAVQAAVEKHRAGRLDGPAVGAGIDGPAPDFVPLAAGFGVPARAVDTVGQLREAMDWARDETGPTLIELRLEAGEHVGTGAVGG